MRRTSVHLPSVVIPSLSLPPYLSLPQPVLTFTFYATFLAKSTSADGSINVVALNLLNQDNEVIAILLDDVGFAPAAIPEAEVGQWVKNNAIIRTGRSKKTLQSEHKEELNEISRERVTPHSYVPNVFLYVIAVDDEDTEVIRLAATIAADQGEIKDGNEAKKTKKSIVAAIREEVKAVRIKMASHGHLLKHLKLLPGLCYTHIDIFTLAKVLCVLGSWGLLGLL